MTAGTLPLTRRMMLALAGSAITGFATDATAAPKSAIKVSKDPNCVCCSGWVEHLRSKLHGNRRGRRGHAGRQATARRAG
jgi:hypothetical protein